MISDFQRLFERYTHPYSLLFDPSVFFLQFSNIWFWFKRKNSPISNEIRYLMTVCMIYQKISCRSATKVFKLFAAVVFVYKRRRPVQENKRSLSPRRRPHHSLLATSKIQQIQTWCIGYRRHSVASTEWLIWFGQLLLSGRRPLFGSLPFFLPTI